MLSGAPGLLDLLLQHVHAAQRRCSALSVRVCSAAESEAALFQAMSASHPGCMIKTVDAPAARLLGSRSLPWRCASTAEVASSGWLTGTRLRTTTDCVGGSKLVAPSSLPLLVQAAASLPRDGLRTVLGPVARSAHTPEQSYTATPSATGQARGSVLGWYIPHPQLDPHPPPEGSDAPGKQARLQGVGFRRALNPKLWLSQASRTASRWMQLRSSF